MPTDDMASPASRAPRAFHKCHYCRLRKRKCLPVERIWPGQKCEGCRRGMLLVQSNHANVPNIVQEDIHADPMFLTMTARLCRANLSPCSLQPSRPRASFSHFLAIHFSRTTISHSQMMPGHNSYLTRRWHCRLRRHRVPDEERTRWVMCDWAYQHPRRNHEMP